MLGLCLFYILYEFSFSDEFLDVVFNSETLIGVLTATSVITVIFLFVGPFPLGDRRKRFYIWVLSVSAFGEDVLHGSIKGSLLGESGSSTTWLTSVVPLILLL